MIIEKKDLENFVPHRSKMLIIDKITNYSLETWTVESETQITENFMFFEKSINGVPNYACFEIMAQTISALTGIYVRENNLPKNIGFILSVSNFSFDFDLLKSGDVIKIKAEREAKVDNVYSFNAEFYLNNVKSGKGKLTVMETSEIPSN